ncbi:uncharacterized protein B0T23DRAFT_404054 [Neurospora hispaniola]|uniref:Uncharacterized protein n=1 Tax=Neurospora hispaniola TaxID=588809 RepID=A0AAJ0IB38_9PEZI|nr:hypothetical protein B0T23DRAFT_404054 [Neurospora hispaniola]
MPPAAGILRSVIKARFALLIEDLFASGYVVEVDIGNGSCDGVCNWTRVMDGWNSRRLRGRDKKLVSGMEVGTELQVGLKVVDGTVPGLVTRNLGISSSRCSNPILPIVWLLATLTEMRRELIIHLDRDNS